MQAIATEWENIFWKTGTEKHLGTTVHKQLNTVTVNSVNSQCDAEANRANVIWRVGQGGDFTRVQHRWDQCWNAAHSSGIYVLKRMLNNLKECRKEPQKLLEGEREHPAVRDLESSIWLVFQKEVSWLQGISAFTGRQYWVLKGSSHYLRKAKQELEAGNWSQANSNEK